MSFQKADTDAFYQKDNLEQAELKLQEAITLIEETSLPWWRLWFAKRKLKKAANLLFKSANSIEVADG